MKRGRKAGVLFSGGYTKQSLVVSWNRARDGRPVKQDYWTVRRIVNAAHVAEHSNPTQEVFIFDVRPSRAADIAKELRGKTLNGKKVSVIVPPVQTPCSDTYRATERVSEYAGA